MAFLIRVLARIAVIVALIGLAACQDIEDLSPKAEKPIPEKLVRVMKAKGMTRTSPVMIRIFKEENVLEVWKRKDNGRYDMVTSYDICKWSGQLGPKYIEGDRQAPEGFYTITPGLMNPRSSYHLAFNTGYPNAFDRANGRTGTHLMVHGACSSAGCYSMTDEQIEEVFAFARDAFRGGQRAFQFQAFPFRMTPENMARYKDDPNIEFWRNIKVGYDLFELTKVPPRVNVCGRRYAFAAAAPLNEDAAPDPCVAPQSSPALEASLASYNSQFQSKFDAVLGSGRLAPPKPSIQGLEEARLVADWSRKRNAGQRVSREPPNLDPKPEPVSVPNPEAVVEPAVVAPAAIEEPQAQVAPQEQQVPTDAASAETVAAAVPVPESSPLAAETAPTTEPRKRNRLWPFNR